MASYDPAFIFKWLSRFILETRQESGQPHPAKSIYLLLYGLHHISRSKGVTFNFLDKSDPRFQDLYKTMDSICSNHRAQGVGAQRNAAHVISAKDEDLFILGDVDGNTKISSKLGILFSGCSRGLRAM